MEICKDEENALRVQKGAKVIGILQKLPKLFTFGQVEEKSRVCGKKSFDGFGLRKAVFGKKLQGIFGVMEKSGRRMKVLHDPSRFKVPGNGIVKITGESVEGAKQTKMGKIQFL